MWDCAATGFDACSTASNHSMDGGAAGVDQTIELLDAAGIETTGTARSAEERFPNLYEVREVTVGQLTGGEIEIVSGLEDGDTIAVLGASNLTEGMKVRPLGD